MPSSVSIGNLDLGSFHELWRLPGEPVELTVDLGSATGDTLLALTTNDDDDEVDLVAEITPATERTPESASDDPEPLDRGDDPPRAYVVVPAGRYPSVPM